MPTPERLGATQLKKYATMNQTHRLLLAPCIAIVSSVELAAPARPDSMKTAVNASEVASRKPEERTAPPSGPVKVPIT
jgi:hypothetical protein